MKNLACDKCLAEYEICSACEGCLREHCQCDPCQHDKARAAECVFCVRVAADAIDDQLKWLGL